MQRVIELVKEQKSNLRLNFGNWGKEILDQIDPDYVHITGVYDEEL